MPGRTRSVEIAGGTVTARELTVQEIYDWLRDTEARLDASLSAPEMPDAIATALFDGTPLPDLQRMSDITEEAWRTAYPSEIEALIGACRELNAHFFSFRGRMGAILEVLLTGQASPTPAATSSAPQTH